MVIVAITVVGVIGRPTDTVDGAIYALDRAFSVLVIPVYGLIRPNAITGEIGPASRGATLVALGLDAAKASEVFLLCFGQVSIAKLRVN